MSERVLLLVAVGAALLAAPVAAQSTAQLEARAHRLEAKEKALADLAALVTQREFESQPRRYFTVAGVTLGYPVEVADAAERALEGVDAAWRVRYGNALSLLANDTLTFMIVRYDGAEWPSARILWRFAGQRGEVGVLEDEVANGPWLGSLPRQVLQRWETFLLGPSMLGWLKAGAPSLDTWDGQFARRELLFSRSGPAKRCLEGSVGDCERALALREGADPFSEWYDRADLMAEARGDRYLSGPGLAACRATGELESCRRTLGVVRPPTGTVVRGSLYLFALAQGGPDALTRIHAAGNRPPAEQLATASGMPIDSLLAKWHAAVVMPRADHGPGEALMLFSIASLWTIALLALFAWRFRWHHV